MVIPIYVVSRDVYTPFSPGIIKRLLERSALAMSSGIITCILSIHILGLVVQNYTRKPRVVLQIGSIDFANDERNALPNIADDYHCVNA